MRIDMESHRWRGVDDLPEFLRRVMSSRCLDESELDDVVQETCVRAARYRSTLADEERLRPWAARIALNVLAARARRRTDPRMRALDDAEAGQVPEREAEEGFAEFVRSGPWLIERERALLELRGAQRELREDDRRLLAAYYGGGESCRHAARVCDVAPGLAKVRLFRARQRLLRLLRKRVALAAWRWIGPNGVVHDLGAPAPAPCPAFPGPGPRGAVGGRR